ncbi:MAG: hypothetical protein WHX60_08600 [Armatimonadota bacterium]
MMGLPVGIDRLLRTVFRMAPWAQMKAEQPTSWWERLLPFKIQKRQPPAFSPLPEAPQPVAPAVATPEPAPAPADYTVDWRKYFNDVYQQLQRRPMPAPPELPMPIEPGETDWQRLLPLAIGLLFAPQHVREGMLQGMAQQYADQLEKQREYVRALAERAYKQAELQRQHQMLQEQQEAQAREDALKLAMSMATDEERRAMQAQMEALRNQRALEVARMQNDMQAVSRHMALANNPALPAEQRAAAYQNAAAILERYGYQLPALPTLPSVQERGQALRETIEPQKMQLEQQRFDFEKWRGQEQVRQGWKRIEQMQQNIAISAARLANSVSSQNWSQAQDTIRNLNAYNWQLQSEEESLTKQLNASTKDELGRPIPVYNIPLSRQGQLLAGATPTSPLEAQWQDLALRLAAVRRERQRAAQLLQNTVLPPTPAATPPATGKPVFKTRGGNTFTP